MPTYEYACSACAHEWEFEQSITASPLTTCPSCGGSTARRQISRGTGFILKGGGWYSDLYTGASNKKPEGTKEAKGGGEGAASGGTPGGGGEGSSSPPAPAGGTPSGAASGTADRSAA